MEGKDVILIDPMLATGKSVTDAVQQVLRKETPKQLHIVSLVAAPEGLHYLENNIRFPHTVWTCAVDEKLNQHFYIVPGLGDAGDLCFGEKV